MKRLLVLGLLLAMVPAVGHGAPPALDQDVRLLHDCNDDYSGSDSLSKAGYDLHTLDLREIYTGSANALVFRIILNGAGIGEIDVNFKVDGSAKTYTFTNSGSWTGTFDKIVVISDVGDDPRFALEGTIAWSKIGANTGAKISAYNAIGTYPDGEDSLLAYNGGITSVCDEKTVFFPDANQDGTPDAYPLRGPVQFFSSNIPNAETTLAVGQQKLIEIQLVSKLQSSQNLELRSSSGAAVDVEFHNIDSNVYQDVGRIGLGPKGGLTGSKVLHVVVAGVTVGEGTIEVVTTSNLGGRVLKTIDYTVTSASSSSSPQSSSSESKESPASFGIALVALALLARRR